MPTRPPSPKAQLAALMSRFPDEIAALAERCLLKLRRRFPGTNELVYDYTKSLVVSFGPSERGSEAVAALSIDSSGVRLYLDKTLPDPTALLKGTGTKVRSLTLESAADLDRADIKALLDAAIQKSGITLPRTGTTNLVIKSDGKKKTTHGSKKRS